MSSNSNPSSSPPPIETLTHKIQESLSLTTTTPHHRFWETQPVNQFKDLSNPTLPAGPIESPSHIPSEPYPLPSPFIWSTLDLSDPTSASALHSLLSLHYVEDDDNMFRFNYSLPFLLWALRPPRFLPSCHLAVRAPPSLKLVAFISAVPASLLSLPFAEVNFLCVHKKLRSKRLAPLLIKELTRRLHLQNIFHAAYTAGVLLPTPFSTSQYFHRSLNPKKLIQVGFSRLGPRMTLARTLRLYKLPPSTSTPGFRKMQPSDVPAVATLLRNYLSKFRVAPVFDEEEVEHWFVPREEVVDSFVVDGLEGITDFCSFYTLPSRVLNNASYGSLKAAYSFYNVAGRTPIVELMRDLLTVAKGMGYDVFNALDVMENEGFLKELKFGPGDGVLHYYLYNYRVGEAVKPSQVGLVLL